MFSIPTESCKIHIIISYLLRNIAAVGTQMGYLYFPIRFPIHFPIRFPNRYQSVTNTFPNLFPNSKTDMPPSVPKRVTSKGNPFGYRPRQTLLLFDNVGWDEEDVAEDDEEVLFNTGEFDFRAAEYSDGGRCGGDRSNIDGDDGGGRAEVDDDDDEDLDEE